MSAVVRRAGARLPTRLKKTLTDKQLVSRLHGPAGDLEFQRQAAHRRHPITGAELALVDGQPEAAVDFLIFGQ